MPSVRRRRVLSLEVAAYVVAVFAPILADARPADEPAAMMRTCERQRWSAGVG